MKARTCSVVVSLFSGLLFVACNNGNIGNNSASDSADLRHHHHDLAMPPPPPPPAEDLAVPASAADMAMSGGDLAAPPAGSGPTISALIYASGPVGGAVLVSGNGFLAGDTVQMSGSTITTTALVTLSLTSTAVLALIPSVGTTPPVDVTVRVQRGAALSNGLAFHVAAGHAYYLAPTGNDSAAGSYAQPWRTIGATSAKMAPGDVAYLRGGTYSGQVAINASGTASAPLTFTAFPGESPLLVEPATTAGADLDTVRVLGSYVVLDHLRVTDQNDPGQAIWIGDAAHDVTISHCEVFGAKGQGILISGKGNTVYRSDIHDNGSHAPFDHGVYVDGGSNVIRSNTIHGNFTWGVQVYNGYVTGPTGAGSNLIESNYIYGNGAGSTAAAPASAAGGMVIGNGQNANTVRNNILCDNAQYGLELIDAEPSNVMTGNVTCYNAKGGLYMRFPGAGNTLTGNISYNDSVFALSSNSGVASDSNYYWAPGGAPQFQWSGSSYGFAAFKTASGQDAHSQLVDAGFKSVPSSGFSPAAAGGYNFCTTLNPALCKPLP